MLNKIKSAFGGKKLMKKSAALIGNGALLVSTLAPLLSPAPALASTTWNVGDVYAGVAGGSYNVYDNAGVFKETISDGLGGFTTGCAFNNSLDKLYTTNFSNSKVVVYNDASPHTIVQTIDTAADHPGVADNESVVFAANGDFYVGNPDGNADLLRYNSAGVFQQAYDVAVEGRGSDWNDLSSDQTTMYYTSEGGLVKRYDVSGAGSQLADFGAGIGGVSYALRLLPPGDGSGGLLVAHSVDIKRLDGTGAVAQTYDAAGEDGWFALNLDPNGTSFWAGDLATNNFYRFNIASGAVEVGPIASSGSLFGLCLKGEPTAAQEDTRRMTGGGTIGDPTTLARHGFELYCDKSKTPNNLEVNWGKRNNFHLETLTSAVCSDDPGITPNPPTASFDTYAGTGTGRYNGVSGATAEWTFTDAGEPGKNDTAKLVIKDATSTVVLSVSGKLKVGNHQAH